MFWWTALWASLALQVVTASTAATSGSSSAPGGMDMPTAATPITQEELLEGLRAMPGLEARYREEKHISLLAAPLRSEGTLHFAPPGRLARHQMHPTRATLLVEGRTMRFGDAHGKDLIDLGVSPVVRLFVDSFLKVLEGDREALTFLYAIELSAGRDGDPRAWTLTLRPKIDPVTHVIDRIVIRGRETIVRDMNVIEVGGDSTLTTFEAVDPRRRYSTAELDRIFALPRRHRNRLSGG